MAVKFHKSHADFGSEANAWQQLRPSGGDGADGPSPREHHTAVWAPSTAQGVGDGMYVFGGFNGSCSASMGEADRESETM